MTGAPDAHAIMILTRLNEASMEGMFLNTLPERLDRERNRASRVVITLNALGEVEMKEVRLSTWADFEGEISSTFDKVRRKSTETEAYVSDMVFRGHANESWKLSTTLERYTTQRYTARDYYHLMRAVEPAVESLTDRSWCLPRTYHMDELVPQSPPGYEFMVYLRHHKFPSPLLDWTRSPYVAAFFAFHSGETSEADVAIYSYMEHSGKGKTWSDGKARIIGLGPYARTHKRHYSQQSEYTICQKRVGGKGTYWDHGDVFARSDEEQDILTKYVIPRTERPKVLEKLHMMNINSYSLFGDEESLMQALAYQEIERRNGL